MVQDDRQLTIRETDEDEEFAAWLNDLTERYSSGPRDDVLEERHLVLADEIGDWIGGLRWTLRGGGAQLIDIGVGPRGRHQGHAHRLLAAFEERAAEHGAHLLEFWTDHVAEEGLLGDMIRPEFEEMGPVLRGALFESREETVGVSLVPSPRPHPYVDELGAPAAQRPAQPADPVADFVCQDEVALLQDIVSWTGGIPLGEVVQPGGELLILIGLANGQLPVVLDHGPLASIPPELSVVLTSSTSVPTHRSCRFSGTDRDVSRAERFRRRWWRPFRETSLS